MEMEGKIKLWMGVGGGGWVMRFEKNTCEKQEIHERSYLQAGQA